MQRDLGKNRIEAICTVVETKYYNYYFKMGFQNLVFKALKISRSEFEKKTSK